MRIAMASEHASPLAALGGVDAGGQNVYVARLSEELALAAGRPRHGVHPP
ncbi:D-inositol-3-phosphate glycosyltransferase [Streptomyces griseomycini]